MKTRSILVLAALSIAAPALAQQPPAATGAQDYEAEHGALIKIEPPEPRPSTGSKP